MNTRDWPVAALAVVGFGLAAYLTVTKLRGSAALLATRAIAGRKHEGVMELSERAKASGFSLAPRR